MDRKYMRCIGLGLTMAAFADGAVAQERGRINDGQPLRIEREPNGLTEPNPERGGVIDVDELLGVKPANKQREEAEREDRRASRQKEKSPERR
ncbi:hypothetical protein KKP04_02255 [Rhodomicrobium sp. Az07]|uniref:hypothetical protein n=1 Tax=Rhodomicrobium sp. Az07 TaxID=2839034 RepID=UPI001BE7ED66|nr:hypothetical protein [Rhodomicrobium sp. Az07]MBT3069693.1 hypothetical protein [Rhodomicrobium sp. Az07]